MGIRLRIGVVWFLGLSPSIGAAAEEAPISYAKDVAPFLEDQCIACHDDGFETSKLSVATVEALLKGGRRGPAIVPGKGAESLLIQYMDGTRQPQMPPKTSIPRDQIAVLRRWIDQGARVDDPQALASRREETLQTARTEAATYASEAPPPVTSLAYSPDGKWLAVASYRHVAVADPATCRVVRSLSCPTDQVTSIAFSQDGRRLAGASGIAGKTGEVRIWETAGWSERRVLRGHADTVLALAWRPGSAQLATSSLDKLVLIWDADGGGVVRTIKNHADVVGAVAYSPDGKRLASGSADKTAKVYDAETGVQLASLAGHNEAVLQVAFSPDSTFLATGGEDRQIRTWKLAKPENPERGFGHTGPVYALAWRPDGSSLLAGAGGRPSFLTFKADNGQRVVNIPEDKLPQDWVYAVAAAPDGQSVAVGGWDGSVSIWSLKDGSRLHSFVPGREPGEPKP